MTLLVLENSTADAACLRVVGQHMHAPIGPAKKCAEDPADEANHNRAPECAPKAAYMKPGNDTRYQKQQQSI